MKDGRVVVLYLEDEPNLAELLRAGLGMFGMIVSPIYCSAEELLGKTSSTEFIAADIMILDIRLPGLTGLELAKRLREQGEKRPISTGPTSPCWTRSAPYSSPSRLTLRLSFTRSSRWSQWSDCATAVR
jgi:response regulator RpfG family c-di-GMP phosphodiesterase